MKKALLALSALVLFVGSASAEILYVPEQFSLEVREAPAPDGAVASRLPSGTPMRARGRQEDFVQIEALDGTAGWVRESELTDRPPPGVLLGYISEIQRERLEQIALLQGRLDVKQAELEGLQTDADASGEAASAPDASGEPAARQALLEEVEDLRSRIAELRYLVAAGDSAATAELGRTVDALREENTSLRARIASAHSLLQGKGVPTTEALARVSAGIPRWVWGVLVVALAAGVVIGATWLDWRYRRRHGGFRI